VAQSDAWDAEKKRYQLKDWGGKTFAYELKASEANSEPIHLACAKCYQDGKIAILQFDHRDSEQQDWYECPACKDRRGYGTRVPRDINSEQGSDYF